jgi:methyl-accepting chemotaxis protein
MTMIKFNNLKIKSKIFLLFSIIICILICGGTLALYASHHAVALMTGVELNGANKSSLQQKIRFKMETNRTAVLLALQHDPGLPISKLHDHPTSVHSDAIRAGLAEIDQLWDQYLALASSPEERQLAEQWHDASGQFGGSVMIKANAEIEAGQWQRLSFTQAKIILPLYRTGDVAAKAMFDFQRTRNQENSAQVAARLGQIRNLVLLVFVAGIALVFWFGVHLTRSLYQQMGGEPGLVVDIIRSISRNDLTRPIPLRGGDQHSLLWHLRGMQRNLAHTVSSMLHASDEIATASGEIASGNLDLSTRNEQQASSLQETASSMEHLTRTVKQNANHAQQANALAISASEAAQKGGAVVSRVVDTMASINTCSKKIVEIIAVIDSIAFQTNILALNAAVEAARAGEEGRGFAVVASEVRNLAQRSAAAAKEIKVLIGDSVETVNVGVSLVEQAGSSMQDILGGIRSVTEIMSEITGASRAQSTGIDQINQSITQIDAVTQQNAALVEEAAAAANALKDQADKLAQMVHDFKISDSSESRDISDNHAVPRLAA